MPTTKEYQRVDTSKDSSVRRLIVLGSTGSIGVNTLRVVEHLNSPPSAGSGVVTTCDSGMPDRGINIVGLAAGTKADQLIEQAKRFGVEAVAIADTEAAGHVRDSLPGVKVYSGQDAALQLVEQTEATDLCSAVVGSAGLPATLSAIKKGMAICLANKETLVAAGELVTSLLPDYGASLIPVDSEHSAIFQCIDPGLNGSDSKGIKRIILTASGGPFRTATKQQMDNATVEQALAHPTWSMGQKISIDSATMMNKGLEIIEAHWLFGLRANQIDVIIHPQSIVHSFVEYEDHSVLAQMGPPDMKTPIQYALVYPRRIRGCSKPMDWMSLNQLDFEQADRAKFGSLDLAYRVIEMGGTSGAILNAANESAVAGFLQHKMPFGQIVGLAGQALEAIDLEPADSLETIMAADRKAREFVDQKIAAMA